MLVTRVGQSLTGTVPLRRLAQQTRSIHIPGRVLKPTNLSHRARIYFTRFIASLRSPPVSRSIQSAPSIRQSLSLPARIALSRPLRAPCLPRAPRIPGNVAQVGLGTARSFSTGRPIFQHLVENVPVAGRAFYEVDWEVKMRQEKNAKVRRRHRSTRKPKLADKLQARPADITNTVQEHEDFDHYFSPASVPLTTTYLQIPLAPTPTARVPLSSGPSPRLLPIPALAKEHASHSKHSIRVSSIFRRLDAARVWDNGASCETFGDPSGLCTILRIKFEGWTQEMVKSVLGDAGKDWCTIQEIREEESSAASLASTPLHSISSGPASSVISGAEGMAFVMPTLDFSASFSAPFTRSETPASHASLSDTDTDYSFPSAPQSVWDDDSMSDVSLETYNSTNEWSSVASSPHDQSCLGFSSDFTDRVREDWLF